MLAWEVLLFLGIRPAKAKRISAAIEFPLIRVLGTALIEAEDLVGQIQYRGKELQSALDAVTPLEIQLCVCVGVIVAIRSLQSQISAGQVVVLVNIGIVMGDAK